DVAVREIISLPGEQCASLVHRLLHTSVRGSRLKGLVPLTDLALVPRVVAGLLLVARPFRSGCENFPGGRDLSLPDAPGASCTDVEALDAAVVTGGCQALILRGEVDVLLTARLRHGIEGVSVGKVLPQEFEVLKAIHEDVTFGASLHVDVNGEKTTRPHPHTHTGVRVALEEILYVERVVGRVLETVLSRGLLGRP